MPTSTWADTRVLLWLVPIRASAPWRGMTNQLKWDDTDHISLNKMTIVILVSP